MFVLYILQTLVFTYVAFLLGKAALSALRWHGTAGLHLVLAVTLGYGGIALIGLVLALVGWLNQGCLYIITAIILIASYKTVIYHIITWTTRAHLKKNLSSLWSSLRAEPVPCILITLWIIGYFAIALSPTAMGKDGLAYHLPFAVEISQNHHITFPVLADAEYGQLPVLGETLYAVTLTLFNNLGVLKLLQFSGFLLLVAGLVLIAKQYIPNRRALYALMALLLACMPIARNALSGGMIDIWAFLFGLIGLGILITSLARKDSNLQTGLILSGTLLGLSLGAKYLALFFGAIGLVEIALISVFYKQSFTTIVRSCLAFAMPALIIGGFWYLKNLILTGNPVFPIFASGGGAEFTSEVGSFIIHRTWYNFFVFPFYLFGTSTYHLPFGIFTALTFAFTYLSFIFLAIKKRLGLLFMSLFIGLELYLGFVFIWSHQIRFIIPALILNSCALIIGLQSIALYFKEKNILSARASRWIERLAMPGLIVFILALLIASAVSFKTELACMSSSRIESCYSRIEGSAYYAIKYINEHLDHVNVIEYFNVFYRYSMRHGNTATDMFCTHINPADIGACLKEHRALYYLDDTLSRKNPWVRNKEAKLRTADYFIKNGTTLFELYDPSRDTYIRLYSIN